MKNLRKLVFIPGMIAIAGIMSCSKDDAAETVATENDMVFDGKTYTVVDGLISDYGSYEPLDGGSTDTHYNYDFDVVDAPLVTITDDGETYLGAGDGTTFHVYIELFSPGTSAFQAGTFSYMNEDGNPTAADIEGKFFFFAGEVELDSDGVENGDLDGPEYEINGGTVTVTGTSASNYSISFDVTTSGGKTLTGSYSGTFRFEDQTD